MPATPANPKAWEDLPIAHKGDVSPNKIYFWVGAALSAWELLDGDLAGIYSAIVPSPAAQAVTSYGVVSSLATRSSMILVAASFVFRETNPVRKEIEALIDDVGKLSGKRNNLAHGRINKITKLMPGLGTHALGPGYYLMPANYLTRKALTPEEMLAMFSQHSNVPADDLLYSKYAYTAADIERYAKTFKDYLDRSERLIERAAKEYARLYPPPEQRVQELEQQVADLQIKLKALEHQLPPR